MQIKHYYSESTRGFYSSKVHGGDKPADCIELTDAEYHDLISKVGNHDIVVNGGRVTANARAAKVQTYADKRRAEYPSVQEQMDMQYWDKFNGTTHWVDMITSIKAAHPKTSV